MIKELRESILQRLKEGSDPLDGFYASKDVKESILAVLIAGRHLLLEGPPGTGKTTAAKIVARLLPSMRVVVGCRFNCDPLDPICPNCIGKKNLKSVIINGNERFVRVQGSPELMPEDLVGEIDLTTAIKYGIDDPRAFTPGKIQKAHRKILFIDELNRIPERTQNSLLQVLEEGITSIAGFDLEVNVNTLVIATINAKESAGAERVSDTLNDRFEMVKIRYPTKEQEISILKRYGKRIEKIEVSDDIIKKAVNITRAGRSMKGIDRPPSVRTTLSIFENSQAVATLHNSYFVRDEDLKKAAIIALTGRINVSIGSKYYDDSSQLINDIFNKAGCFS